MFCAFFFFSWLQVKTKTQSVGKTEVNQRDWQDAVRSWANPHKQGSSSALSNPDPPLYSSAGSLPQGAHHWRPRGFLCGRVITVYIIRRPLEGSLASWSSGNTVSHRETRHLVRGKGEGGHGFALSVVLNNACPGEPRCLRNCQKRSPIHIPWELVKNEESETPSRTWWVRTWHLPAPRWSVCPLKSKMQHFPVGSYISFMSHEMDLMHQKDHFEGFEKWNGFEKD